MKLRERRRRGRRNRLIDRTSMLNDDGMAAYDFLGILMTRKMLSLLSELSRDSTKLTNMIAEQEIIFGKTVKNVIPPKSY